MYQLVLGIGWGALKTRFLSYDLNKYQVDWKRIEQHKILLNKVIMEHYLRYAKDEGVDVERVQLYISSKMNNRENSEMAGKINGDTIDVVFGNYFRGKKDKGLILYSPDMESERCSKNNCKYQIDISKGVFNDKSSFFSLYSPDNTVMLYAGDAANKYLKFIEHMVAGESVVNFIDPYIAADNNIQEFCDTYLSMIAKDTTMNLLVSKYDGMQNWGVLRQTAKEKGIKLIIYPCDKETMHDRFITTRDSLLSIGAGLVFFDSEINEKKNIEKKVKVATVFNYQKKNEICSDLEFEKGLAGGKVGKPQ